MTQLVYGDGWDDIKDCCRGGGLCSKIRCNIIRATAKFLSFIYCILTADS